MIFHYWPMYGAVIAFKHFTPIKGILGSPWAGFAHFERFFNSYFFELLIRNTILISVYVLLAAFPVPIAFALMVNQVDYPLLRKTLQTASYVPYFISMVVFIGMIFLFLSPTNGVVNRLIMFLGGGATDFMGSAAWFRHVYVGTEIWKETGFAAIIYLAVLSTINPELHEAAIVDGATKLQRIIHIDIPGIVPTAVVLLILRVGRLIGTALNAAVTVLAGYTDLNVPTTPRRTEVKEYERELRLYEREAQSICQTPESADNDPH